MSGVFSLLAALVAAGTAIWIALRVYPLQKAQDRKIKLQEEQAAVYREFFNAANDYFEAVKDGFRRGNIENFDRHYPDVLKTRQALLLYAPKDVIAACNDYSEALFAYRAAVRREANNQDESNAPALRRARGSAFHRAKDALDFALIKSRVSLLGCSEDEARQVLVAQDAPAEENAQ